MGFVWFFILLSRLYHSAFAVGLMDATVCVVKLSNADTLNGRLTRTVSGLGGGSDVRTTSDESLRHFGRKNPVKLS